MLLVEQGQEFVDAPKVLRNRRHVSVLVVRVDVDGGAVELCGRGDLRDFSLQHKLDAASSWSKSANESSSRTIPPKSEKNNWTSRGQLSLRRLGVPAEATASADVEKKCLWPCLFGWKQISDRARVYTINWTPVRRNLRLPAILVPKWRSVQTISTKQNLALSCSLGLQQKS